MGFGKQFKDKKIFEGTQNASRGEGKLRMWKLN
jgi:hypothetical protein